MYFGRSKFRSLKLKQRMGWNIGPSDATDLSVPTPEPSKHLPRNSQPAKFLDNLGLRQPSYVDGRDAERQNAFDFGPRKRGVAFAIRTVVRRNGFSFGYAITNQLLYSIYNSICAVILIILALPLMAILYILVLFSSGLSHRAITPSTVSLDLEKDRKK